jgi:hypothetical protein
MQVKVIYSDAIYTINIKDEWKVSDLIHDTLMRKDK